VKSELHNNAPKRVMMHIAAAVETVKVKGFHPKPKCGEDSHNYAPKRVTTHAGIAIIGTQPLVASELGLRTIIWLLPKPKHCQ
jgi:hypothetical protein